MKKWIAIAAAATAIWVVAQNAAGVKPLASIVPAPAMLYLEAKDLNSLVSSWNGSAGKRAWLQSANHEVFSKSKLYLRLRQVYEEYAAGVGLPPDMNLLSAVAGGESALAIYDISKLEFLYVTRLPSARAMQSVLWQARTRFTQRSAAGVTYYSKSASNRTAAFAIAGDMLLLATAEPALIGALGLLSGAPDAAVQSEPWFQEAVQAAGAAGEVRMVLNMEKLGRAPSFRSYWVQRNITELRQFNAAIADLRRQPNEYREERVLLRSEAVTAPDADAAGQLARMAPPDATVYRAWASPGIEASAQWIAGKVLRPSAAPVADPNAAPSAATDPGEIGDESDLESRLDAPRPADLANPFKLEILTALLRSNTPRGILFAQTARLQPDQVFVTYDSAIVLLGQSPWNNAAVRDALQRTIEDSHTTARIGLNWRDRQGVSEADGLAPVAFTIRGNVIVIANRAEAALAMLAQPNSAAPPVTYAAGYRFAPEIANYQRMMRLIEAPGAANASAEPPFFSSNIGSLAQTLQRLQSAAITARDDGKQVKETVVYRITP